MNEDAKELVLQPSVVDRQKKVCRQDLLGFQEFSSRGWGDLEQECYNCKTKHDGVEEGWLIKTNSAYTAIHLLFPMFEPIAPIRHTYVCAKCQPKKQRTRHDKKKNEVP